MSGGGFCNFTNLEVTPAHYLSQNPHFVKSALARYTNWDFISLVAEQGITYHEKEWGQLFCDEGAEQIVEMLKSECDKYAAKILLRSEVSQVELIQNDEKVRFVLQVNSTQWQCKNLIVATGGLSMPGLGATPFGYQIAEQFGIPVIPPRASLVPFTYRETDKFLTALSGISLPVTITALCGKSFTTSFCLLIVVFQALRYCKFPIIGSPLSQWKSIYYRTTMWKRKLIKQNNLLQNKC